MMAIFIESLVASLYSSNDQAQQKLKFCTQTVQTYTKKGDCLGCTNYAQIYQICISHILHNSDIFTILYNYFSFSHHGRSKDLYRTEEGHD